MGYTALICARGGSKGVPNKNIRMINGRPLIAWAIDGARRVSEISRVIVSTDSEEIAAVSRESGAEVPFMRPPELARDDSPEWLVWRHALGFLREETGSYPKALVVAPTTAPLRKPEDILACIREYEKGGADVVITVTEAHRSPYFNMVTLRQDGSAELVIKREGTFSRRQDTPKVYDMTTVAYVARPEHVLRCGGIFEGRVHAVMIPPERALDIDTLMDFRIAEFLMSTEASTP